MIVIRSEKRKMLKILWQSQEVEELCGPGDFTNIDKQRLVFINVIIYVIILTTF